MTNLLFLYVLNVNDYFIWLFLHHDEGNTFLVYKHVFDIFVCSTLIIGCFYWYMCLEGIAIVQTTPEQLLFIYVNF